MQQNVYIKILKNYIKYTQNQKNQDKPYYGTEMSVHYKMGGELMSQHIKEIAGALTEC